MSFVVVIPARYASTRFPGKPLALLGGKPVIRRVCEQVGRAVGRTVVATDDERILTAVRDFGGEAVTYEGVGGAKKWERIESYGPKFVENIVQAISRDILAHSMRTLSHFFVCGHVHDELIIECSMGVSLYAVCEQMGRTPHWISGLLLRADGYECSFYKKD